MNDLYTRFGLTKNLLIALGVLIVVIIGWYFLIFQNQLKTSQGGQQQIDRMEAALERSQAGVGNVAAVQEKTEDLQDQINEIKSKIVRKKEVPGIIAHIVTKGEQNGINFVSIEPATDKLFQAGSANSGYFRLPISMDLVADYLDFGKFVEQMNQVPFYFSIEQINLKYSQELFPKLQIHVQAQVVLDQSPKEIAAN